MLAICRVLLVLVYFILVNIAIILVCIGRPFHPNNLYFAAQGYLRCSRILGLRVEVKGALGERRAEPVVFIANHQNNYDLITACAAAQPGTVCVGKKSLIWIPLFGLVYWLSGNMFIDRNDKKKSRQSLNQLVQKVRDKRLSVWFFPEGTRSRGRGLLPFKGGAFRIAEEVHLPIVRVSVSNLHNKVNWNRWCNGTVRIDVSLPEYMDDNRSFGENIDYFHQQMSDTITHLNQQDIAITKGQK